MQYKNLITELMFIDDACNFRCTYCTAPMKAITKKNGSYYLRESDDEEIELNASKEKKLGIRMHKHFERVSEIVPTPILSLIGGELTLIDSLVDFLQEVSSNYKLVILTTNGSHLDKSMIDSLSKIDNLLLYMSLDGYNYEMNSYRVSNKNIIHQILKSLDYCIEKEIKVELQMVLHDRNAKFIREYADYVLQYAKKGHYIKLMPFPVRWTKGKYSAQKDMLGEIKKLYDEYEAYQEILPPKAYIRNLLDFYECGQRTTRCYVPEFVTGIDDRGRIKSCPCIPFIYGSIEDNVETARDKILNEKMEYRKRKFNSGFCRTCYEGACEMLNAYLEGNISTDELQRMQIGKIPDVVDYLNQIKNDVVNNKFLY